MNRDEYQRIIQEMCAHTGIEDSQTIVDSQNVVVDHTTVGLMYRDDDESDSSMFLYVDFGPIDIPDLYQKLLELNADRVTEQEGHFGCQADMSAIVYRGQIHLVTERKGEELTEKIQQFLQLGRHRLQETLSSMLFIHLGEKRYARI